MNSNYIVYDIMLNENNLLCIYIYNLVQKQEVVEGKVRSYYCGYYVKDFVSDDLAKDIKDLVDAGVMPMTKFATKEVMAFVPKALIYLKMLLLTLNHKALELVYDEVIVDNVLHLVGYATYVNMNNGKIYALNIGDYGIVSDEKIAELELYGYKNIKNSFLFSHINDLGKVGVKRELKKQN